MYLIFIKVHVATLTACCKCVCLEGGKSDIFDNAKKEKRICDCQRHELYGEPTVSRVEWESHWLSLLSHGEDYLCVQRQVKSLSTPRNIHGAQSLNRVKHKTERSSQVIDSMSHMVNFCPPPQDLHPSEPEACRTLASRSSLTYPGLAAFSCEYTTSRASGASRNMHT